MDQSGPDCYLRMICSGRRTDVYSPVARIELFGFIRSIALRRERRPLLGSNLPNELAARQRRPSTRRPPDLGLSFWYNCGIINIIQQFDLLSSSFLGSDM